MDNPNPILKIMQGDSNTNPDDVNNALNQTGNQNYNGWCQAFVEQTSGIRPKGDSSTAYNAWNSFLKNGQGVQSTMGIKPGDLLYFSPNTSNNNDGHTGIYLGNGKFVSATDNGVKTSDVAQWQMETGQQILGYVPHNTQGDNPILNIMQGGNQ